MNKILKFLALHKSLFLRFHSPILHELRAEKRRARRRVRSMLKEVR